MPRKIEVRRTQAYALLAARRLFEPMRGSTLYEEIDLAAQKLFAVARRPGRGPNAGVADARLEDRFLYLPFAPKDYAAHTEELDDLFQAVADLRPLRCRYRRGQGRRRGPVTIHPYAMVLYKDAVYCVGLHVGKNEIRTFLLDRMRDTECAATERFELPRGLQGRRLLPGPVRHLPRRLAAPGGHRLRRQGGRVRAHPPRPPLAGADAAAQAAACA